MTKEALPVLAEAAGVLSDQLRRLLERLAVRLRPESEQLERRFLKRLERLDFTAPQRKAISNLTLGAAARILSGGGSPGDFFEQVEYSGQRLAKLNVPPGAIVSALGEYDRLVGPALRRLLPSGHENYQWVRDQLHFCVMLTLNNAFYHVREGETQAFYEMFWAEVESVGLGELMGRFLAVLARFCRADQARLYLSPVAGAPLERHGSYGLEAGPPEPGRAGPRRPRALGQPRCFAPRRANKSWMPEPDWARRFAQCWSVPLISRGRVAGAMQFVFVRPYEWLPREVELLTAAAERCMLAAEKARLLSDLRNREVQIRGLAGRMMQVEEAERRRISRELHDQTGQDLLWIRLQMEMLEQELPEKEQRWKSRLAEVRDMTERTIVEIRRLIAALSPAVLEQLGLAPALRQLVQRFRANHTSRVRLQIGRLQPMPKRLEVVAYRLVQECLNNVAKHSFCSNVMIRLRTADGHLRLSVEDDGVGFRVEDSLQKSGSFGLSGIRERVALLGGRCTIDSSLLEPETGAPAPAVRKKPTRGAVRKRGRKGGSTAAGRRWSSGTAISVELPVRFEEPDWESRGEAAGPDRREPDWEAEEDPVGGRANAEASNRR